MINNINEDEVLYSSELDSISEAIEKQTFNDIRIHQTEAVESAINVFSGLTKSDNGKKEKIRLAIIGAGPAPSMVAAMHLTNKLNNVRHIVTIKATDRLTELDPKVCALHRDTLFFPKPLKL